MRRLYLTGAENVDLLFMHRVTVLVEEPGDFVRDLVREMGDNEPHAREPRLGEVLAVLALFVQLLHPRTVRPFRHLEIKKEARSDCVSIDS